MAVDGFPSAVTFSQQATRQSAAAGTCLSHEAAMSWPGIKRVYVRNTSNKRTKTADLDHAGAWAAGGEANGHAWTGQSAFGTAQWNVTQSYTQGYNQTMADKCALSEMAGHFSTGPSTSPPAQRAYSAPVHATFLDDTFAPGTPPMLQLLSHSSPPTSPPWMLRAAACLGHTGRPFGPTATVSAATNPSGDLNQSLQQTGDQDVHHQGPTAGLLSAAFRRCLANRYAPNAVDVSDTISTGSNCDSATLSACTAPPLPRHAGCSCNPANTPAAPEFAQSDAGASEDADEAQLVVTVVLEDPKPESPKEMEPAAAALEAAAAAGDDAACPFLPPYNLDRSALWHAGLPRGKPPLPRLRRYGGRRISLAPTLSADLHLIACPPEADSSSHDNSGADSGTSSHPPTHSVSARAILMGSASPFGRAFGLIGGSAAAEAHPRPNPELDMETVSWGGAAWTHQTSPFAQFAQEEPGAQDAAVADSDAAAVAASIARPASPGPVSVPSDTVPTPASSGSGAAMDDEELDDYYLNTLCGGCDPLAVFMQQVRSQELAASQELQEGEGEVKEAEAAAVEGEVKKVVAEAVEGEVMEAVVETAAVEARGSAPASVSLLRLDTPAIALEVDDERLFFELSLEGAAEVQEAASSPRPSGCGCGGVMDAVMTDASRDVEAAAAAASELSLLQPPQLVVVTTSCCDFHAAELHPSQQQHLRRQVAAQQQQRQHQRLDIPGVSSFAAAGSDAGGLESDGTPSSSAVPSPTGATVVSSDDGGWDVEDEADASQQVMVELERVDSCAHCSVAADVRHMVEHVVWANCFSTMERSCCGGGHRH